MSVKGMINRSFLLIAAVILFGCIVLTGCTIKTPGDEGTTVRITKNFKENELFFLEQELCTVSQAKLYLMNQKNLYTSRYGQEIWSATFEGQPLYAYLEQNLRDFLIRLKCMVLMAEANQITLSSDDVALIDLATDSYFNSLSSDEIAYADVTIDDIREAFSDYYLANKLYRVLTQDAKKEISDDEARIITVQMIYLPYDHVADSTERESSDANVPTESDTMGPEEVQSMESLIHELHRRVTQGEEDFFTVAEGYNRGEWTENQIRRGEMEPAFESAAFSLSSGAISKVINGETGYYVIKCINNHEKELTDAHRKELIEAWRKDLFRREYDAFVTELYLNFNDAAWNSIDFGAVVPEYSYSFYSCYEEFLSGNE